MRKAILPILISLALTGTAAAQCGGSFSSFVAGLKAEAQAKGHSKSTVDAFFRTAAQDKRTLRADRAQGVFKMPFTEFARRVISQNRMDNGRRNAQRFDAVFDQAEARFGVPRGVLLALWALETDYGAVQGDFNTLNSLVTLAHDCRRPELFRPQVFAALELYEAGDFDPARTTGAWAGEIGMVQMLPEDILTKGIDGDGDGHVYLKTSAPDALLSGANMLSGLGWRKGEPWLQEVSVPSDLNWAETGLTHRKSGRDWARMGVTPRWGEIQSGLKAALILPQGRKGPAFLAYPNFDVFFEWNQSFVYVTTAAYFATRLSGAPVFDAGSPEPGLNDAQMKQLQTRLQAKGYDVGKIDGILGARTRAAVQAEQARLGLPADAWPTQALLSKL
ncbi:lytic murein transglycosylase [Dinoroseobacter sp. S124A]|uniref:lytic murein transglycosylase n=1 Tax=Dinoroseobacter sp. S124A TaxID=3415128 RepID=UPI003C7ABCA9